jgi:hypothetical protein
MGTSLTVPGWISLSPESEGWAALNRVRARAEAAPAARPRPASERRDQNSTSLLPEEAAVYRMVLGRSGADLKCDLLAIC